MSKRKPLGRPNVRRRIVKKSILRKQKKQGHHGMKGAKSGVNQGERGIESLESPKRQQYYRKLARGDNDIKKPGRPSKSATQSAISNTMSIRTAKLLNQNTQKMFSGKTFNFIKQAQYLLHLEKELQFRKCLNNKNPYIAAAESYCKEMGTLNEYNEQYFGADIKGNAKRRRKKQLIKRFKQVQLDKKRIKFLVTLGRGSHGTFHSGRTETFPWEKELAQMLSLLQRNGHKLNAFLITHCAIQTAIDHNFPIDLNRDFDEELESMLFSDYYNDLKKHIEAMNERATKINPDVQPISFGSKWRKGFMQRHNQSHTSDAKRCFNSVSMLANLIPHLVCFHTTMLMFNIQRNCGKILSGDETMDYSYYGSKYSWQSDRQDIAAETLSDLENRMEIETAKQRRDENMAALGALNDDEREFIMESETDDTTDSEQNDVDIEMESSAANKGTDNLFSAMIAANLESGTGGFIGSGKNKIQTERKCHSNFIFVDDIGGSRSQFVWPCANKSIIPTKTETEKLLQNGWVINEFKDNLVISCEKSSWWRPDRSGTRQTHSVLKEEDVGDENALILDHCPCHSNNTWVKTLDASGNLIIFGAAGETPFTQVADKTYNALFAQLNEAQCNMFSIKNGPLAAPDMVDVFLMNARSIKVLNQHQPSKRKFIEDFNEIGLLVNIEDYPSKAPPGFLSKLLNETQNKNDSIIAKNLPAIFKDLYPNRSVGDLSLREVLTLRRKTGKDHTPMGKTTLQTNRHELDALIFDYERSEAGKVESTDTEKDKYWKLIHDMTMKNVEQITETLKLTLYSKEWKAKHRHKIMTEIRENSKQIALKYIDDEIKKLKQQKKSMKSTKKSVQTYELILKQMELRGFYRKSRKTVLSAKGDKIQMTIDTMFKLRELKQQALAMEIERHSIKMSLKATNQVHCVITDDMGVDISESAHSSDQSDEDSDMEILQSNVNQRDALPEGAVLITQDDGTVFEKGVNERNEEYIKVLMDNTFVHVQLCNEQRELFEWHNSSYTGKPIITYDMLCSILESMMPDVLPFDKIDYLLNHEDIVSMLCDEGLKRDCIYTGNGSVRCHLISLFGALVHDKCLVGDVRDFIENIDDNHDQNTEYFGVKIIYNILMVYLFALHEAVVEHKGFESWIIFEKLIEKFCEYHEIAGFFGIGTDAGLIERMLAPISHRFTSVVISSICTKCGRILSQETNRKLVINVLFKVDAMNFLTGCSYSKKRCVDCGVRSSIVIQRIEQRQFLIVYFDQQFSAKFALSLFANIPIKTVDEQVAVYKATSFILMKPNIHYFAAMSKDYKQFIEFESLYRRIGKLKYLEHGVKQHNIALCVLEKMESNNNVTMIANSNDINVNLLGQGLDSEKKKLTFWNDKLTTLYPSGSRRKLSPITTKKGSAKKRKVSPTTNSTKKGSAKKKVGSKKNKKRKKKSGKQKNTLFSMNFIKQ